LCTGRWTGTRISVIPTDCAQTDAQILFDEATVIKYDPNLMETKRFLNTI
jgi:hypothetical protein